MMRQRGMSIDELLAVRWARGYKQGTQLLFDLLRVAVKFPNEMAEILKQAGIAVEPGTQAAPRPHLRLVGGDAALETRSPLLGDPAASSVPMASSAEGMTTSEWLASIEPRGLGSLLFGLRWAAENPRETRVILDAIDRELDETPGLDPRAA